MIVEIKIVNVLVYFVDNEELNRCETNLTFIHYLKCKEDKIYILAKIIEWYNFSHQLRII